VGAPPLMLAISVREAIRDAIASYGPGVVELDSPCTPERIFFALEKARAAPERPAVVPAGATHQ
jgi:xanthine dehydrogenase large subunit